MAPRISVAIPCYEMGGCGVDMLEFSFNKLIHQSLQDFETVITDHSQDNLIEKLCDSWEGVINIKYFKNTEKRGSPTSNTNLGIAKSEGEIIKLLCQDDYLYDEQALQIIDKNFASDVNWMATSYLHTTDRARLYNKHVPRLSDNIALKNLLGTPSAFTIRNGVDVWFDENLSWFYDGDFYRRMVQKFGNPKVIDKITMVNYLHADQVTNTIANHALKNKEQQYVTEKMKNA